LKHKRFEKVTENSTFLCKNNESRNLTDTRFNFSQRLFSPYLITFIDFYRLENPLRPHVMLHQTIEESWNLALVLISSTDLGSRITHFWLTQALIKISHMLFPRKLEPL